MKIKLLAFVAVLSLVYACKTEVQDEKPVLEDGGQDTSIVSNAPTLPKDRKFDDLARFLGGEEGDDSSIVKPLESTQVWKTYKLKLDEIWKKTNEKLPVMKEWTSTELADVNKDGGTLFYPFSGPDFLHADVFFPEYDNIIMIGLEPIGSYPDMLRKSKDGKDEIYLNGVLKSMHAILGLSFFRTIAMADDFRGEVDGTLPILMQFMNRMDNEVIYQERVAVMRDGELTNEINGLADSTYIGNRYYFKRRGTDKIRTLTYFAVNLQNDAYVSRGGLVANGLETRKDFMAYLQRVGVKATYLKSASYLMHRPSFSIIRDFILTESEYLLQDDSGIPVEFFENGKWDLTFYGTYTRPISLFAERHQERLKVIYEQEGVRLLPFGIGYQYKQGTSNLMLARKK